MPNCAPRSRQRVAEGQAELDQLTQKIIAAGLASWSGGEADERQLIVRGHANLLDDLHALEDLERVRSLFDDLETKRGVIDLLGRAERADGVRIFIGSENKLFSLSGSSTIVAPYRDSAGPHRRRDRRDRPDPAQLRPHHPDGRLHRPGGQPGCSVRLTLDFCAFEALICRGIRIILRMESSHDGHGPPARRYGAADRWRSAPPRRNWFRPSRSTAAWKRAAEFKDKLLRTLAEMENLRRRTEREVADARLYGIASFARDVLAVADNMHRALEAIDPELRAQADAKVKALIEGVELTERELLKALEKNGVKQILAAGREVRSQSASGDVRDAETPTCRPATSRR